MPTYRGWTTSGGLQHSERLTRRGTHGAIIFEKGQYRVNAGRKRIIVVLPHAILLPDAS